MTTLKRASYDVDYDHIANNYSWSKRAMDGKVQLFPPSKGGPTGMDDADALDLGAWDEDGAVYEWALHRAPEAIHLAGEKIERDFESLRTFSSDKDARSTDEDTDWRHIIYREDDTMYSKVPDTDKMMLLVELNEDYTVRRVL
jgi:hypothetical protein